MCSSVTVGTGKKVLKTFYKVGYFREIGVFLSLLLRHDTSRSLDDNYKVGGHYNKVKTTTAVDFFPSNDFHVFIFGKLCIITPLLKKWHFLKLERGKPLPTFFLQWIPNTSSSFSLFTPSVSINLPCTCLMYITLSWLEKVRSSNRPPSFQKYTTTLF